VGPGADRLTIDAQGNSSILSASAGAQVVVSGLTLADGSAIKDGAISNAGTLALADCTLTGNTATAGVGPDGGAIFNTGALSLTDCTLSANTSGEDGGAIYTSGSLALAECTISGNSANTGGGIYRSGSSQPGTSLVRFGCTISGNSASFGGGIVGRNVIMNNTIVANSGLGGDLFGTFSGSNNLIEDAGNAGGLASGVNGNLVGVDPKLGALGYNGGSTQTMALLAGSPAIGAGDSSLLPSGVTTDQRGFALDSPKPDIGAFQYQGPSPTVTISGPTTGTSQVDATFTLTASDPTPANQSGTFTYTIDWNGDGSDIQTIKGPASLQVSHAYFAAGTFTPSVTALDKLNRVSNLAVLAAPVVVTGTSPAAIANLIQSGDLTISVSTLDQASIAVDSINSIPAAAWSGSNSATIRLTSLGTVTDTVINPTSPSANVNISPSNDALTIGQLVTVNNPYASGGSTGLTIAATVVATVALAFVGGSAVGLLSAASAASIGVLGLTTTSGWIFSSGVVAAGTGVGILTGVTVGGSVAAGLVVYDQTQGVAVGGSPALIVDQGTATVSRMLFSTVTDSPTVIMNGGTLNLLDNFIAGNVSGSQPLIKVNAGTLILGTPDGTHPDAFGAYGSAPFIQVAGSGMVIVQPGVVFAQIDSVLTAQAAGTTSVQLVSSEPIASPGDTITLTANVTAGSAAATDGSVEFFDNTTGAFLGFVPVSNGSAAIQATFNALTAGDTIYATYLPTTGAMAPSSGLMTLVVAAATQTAVTGPASTPVFGQSVTVTATVTDTTTGGGTPIGTVEFFDGTTDLGPGTPLNGGGSTATSTISTTSLTAGSHTIEAVFTPSSSFQGGSGFLSQVVNQASPTITWPSPTDIVFGTALSGTQLDAEATNPENGESVDGTFAYDPSQGTVLSAGSDESLDVTFTPSDTTDYASPVAFSTSINVTTHSTMTTLAGSTPEGAPGQTVTFTATVVGGLPDPYLPTGSVQFRINGVNAGSPVPLSASDTAVFSTTEPVVGAFTVTAIYSGDTDFSGSPSPAFTEAVLTPGVFEVGSTLFVVGANTSENALLLPWGSKLDGSTGLFVLADLNHSAVAKTFAQTFTAIDVFGYGGNDNILLFPTLALPTTVSEGNGNNLIVLANGQDTVTLGSGNNQVSGGDGNKTITVADTTRTSTSIALGDGNNVISLGAGNDRVVLGKGNDRVTAGNGNDAVFASGNGVDVVALGNGNDSVHLGDGSNTVTLGDGNDEASAGNGNDNVTVGNGNDLISLGNGSDVIVEGNGNDSASAGNGSDLVVAGLGRHTILLGNGNDILIDGSATVVNSGDSLRQILTAWNANQSTSVTTRLKVVYNTSHPNVLKAGSGRNWWFYTYSKDVTNKKSSDRLN
jgi:predicted outer membrane repeat protein